MRRESENIVSVGDASTSSTTHAPAARCSDPASREAFFSEIVSEHLPARAKSR